uniref:uncharacterized protein isoform X4 n=1 Tax=Pristiophorus japonicus TaxID=55135 RepID=UPI00398F840D
MPPKASSFHRLMACRCLLLYFFWFHTGKETPWSDCIKQKDKLTQLANQEQVKPNDARYAVLIVSGILEECNASISVGLESDLHNVLMKVDFPEDSKTFVTPNVKATVIKVNPRSNLEVVGTVYFSWVGPEDQRVIVAVQVKFPCQLHTSPKAVVTQFKNKTSFQGQERSPVSLNIIIRVRSSSIDDLTSPLTFQDMWERNSTLCGVLDSEQKVDPNGCNIQTGDNITCRCDRLGFFFAVTLESQGLFDFVPSGHPFKITTRTNHPTNINVATPVADISYDTSLVKIRPPVFRTPA